MHPPKKLRILLLVHSFNSLSQRFFVELCQWGHTVSVEYDIHDEVTLEAFALFRPDLVIAPYLKRILPPAILQRQTCLIVHPGVVGDRGPSSLDRAILAGESMWGVTILKAAPEVDGGAVLATRPFVMREAAKSSLYRNELTEAAVLALKDLLDTWGPGAAEQISSLATPPVTPWQPLLLQSQRSVDWAHDDTASVLKKIRSSDAHPGVNGEILGVPVKIYGAHPEGRLRGAPGELLAQRNHSICIATLDGAVWLTHLLRRASADALHPIKLPAAQVLGADRLTAVPEDAIGFAKVTTHETYQDIYYTVEENVGYLHFPVHGGALSLALCERLVAAYRALCQTDGLSLLVLCGGDDFWMNGIDLNAIEAAPSPADASWHNINALNDFVREVIETTSLVTIAAMAGGAAAGGAFAALACDEVWAREGIVLSPHYKNMGNLYGSEYWTYLLARKVKDPSLREKVLALRVPIGVLEAKSLGLVDQCAPGEKPLFHDWVRTMARDLSTQKNMLQAMLKQKRELRRQDESRKPLSLYREEELQRMKLNFYGMDPSYHKARYNFVHRVALSRTPRYLALHRDSAFTRTAEATS